MEDLEHIWRDVTSTTAGSIPKVIAARLERGHAPAVDLGHVPWREFLDLAAAVGARVVYAELSRLNDDVLSQFESFDEDGSATAETIAARQSVGEPFLLELAFVFDGVVHEWSTYASWFEELAHRENIELEVAAGAWELERTEQLRELEDFHLRAQVWERELASSREFFGQPNENDRRSVVGKLIPELGSHLAARGTSTFSPALDVVRRAWTLARNEVIPMKIAEVRADADRVAQEIALDPDFQAAARRADRERVIRRHLERDYGLRDPGLVQIIERAAH